MRNETVRGLSKEEVLKSKEKYGSNIISNERKHSFMKLFVDSLGDPIIKILLIVLAVKTVFLFQNFDWFETLGIVIAILLASLISTISEYGSEKSFQKMQEESSRIKCKVIRDGQVQEVFIDDVVVGDIAELSSGDMIPADGQILDSTITVDESSFTGETKDVIKNRGDEIYRGSVVLNGTSTVKITRVGSNTKYGKIALELLSKNPESPLKIRLRELAGIISKIGYTGALLVMISYLFSVIFVANSFNLSLIFEMITTPRIIFGHIIYALTLAVTIIIVSVPEGLPMMVALVLSSNMKKMVKNNVMVRRMVGIETAGCINTLLSDKTGTITKGNMEVVGIILGDGTVLRDKNELDKSPKLKRYILTNMKFNNESTFDPNNEVIGGNITDKALLQYSQFFSSNPKILEHNYFNSTKKYSSIIIDDGITHELIKGAPEKLLSKTQYFYDHMAIRREIDKDLVEQCIKKYTSLGYRVLMLADRPSKYSDYLILLSLILLKDEIGSTAKEALEMIEGAGVHTIMITGDAKETAINIGKEIGLLKSEKDLILTSDELKTMSDDAIMKRYDSLRIIARALPEDKSRLVRLGQRLGKVVGMTGDGVNDAPALKIADVGFAMGSGSEVSKEASDIVILDNNLLSIGKAILYGRTIFKSIRKFIIFQLTMNLCALTMSIVGPFIGINTPVTVMQMLWINMIMDTLAGLAFSFEPPLKEYMKAKPIKKDASIMNRYMYSNILVTGMYTSLLLILFLKLPFLKEIFRYDINDKYLLTSFFGLFVFAGVFNAFNARTHRLNIFANISKNKPFIAIICLIAIVQIILLFFGGDTFRTYGLNLKEFTTMMIIALTVIPVDCLRKLILKKNSINTGV